MKWHVELSASARRQITDTLAVTLNEFGERQLAEYAELIQIALNRIAEDPMGARSAALPALHPDARTYHIGLPGRRARHLFVYRMRPGGRIDVGRFLHDAMDLPRHLPKGFRRDG